MAKNAIDLETARRCNESGQEIELGMYVVVNRGSGQVLVAERDELDACCAKASIEYEHDLDLDVAIVQ